MNCLRKKLKNNNSLIKLDYKKIIFKELILIGNNFNFTIIYFYFFISFLKVKFFSLMNIKLHYLNFKKFFF